MSVINKYICNLKKKLKYIVLITLFIISVITVTIIYLYCKKSDSFTSNIIPVYTSNNLLKPLENNKYYINILGTTKYLNLNTTGKPDWEPWKTDNVNSIGILDITDNSKTELSDTNIFIYNADTSISCLKYPNYILDAFYGAKMSIDNSSYMLTNGYEAGKNCKFIPIFAEKRSNTAFLYKDGNFIFENVPKFGDIKSCYLGIDGNSYVAGHYSTNYQLQNTNVVIDICGNNYSMPTTESFQFITITQEPTTTYNTPTTTLAPTTTYDTPTTTLAPTTTYSTPTTTIAPTTTYSTPTTTIAPTTTNSTPTTTIAPTTTYSTPTTTLAPTIRHYSNNILKNIILSLTSIALKS